MQHTNQIDKNTFEQRYLYHPSVENLFRKTSHRKKLYSALRENVIEVKAEEFSNAIINARKDFNDSRRHALVLQAFVDELYKFKNLGRPPIIEATVTQKSDTTKYNVTWNIDMQELEKQSGKYIKFHNGIPLTASAHSNRLIWSAANLESDLYLSTPMSTLVGDKLYESAEKISKAGKIIEELKVEVEFPDVRNLVNSGKMDLGHVLEIRKKAKKFRNWLQQESDRDRNAIIAYHHEVARDCNIKSGLRKAMNIFGVLSGGAVGGTVGSLIGGPIGGAVGGTAGSAVGYLADVTSKIGKNWRPVIFGEWLKGRIEEVVKE